MAEISNSNLYDISKGIPTKDAFVVIVRTEWNAAIVDRLEDGCRAVLSQHQVAFRVVTVPGAFEIPFAVKSYWDTLPPEASRPDVFIALACVVRGGTPHFDYVCKGITDGIVQLNLTLPVPTIFGVLTVDNDMQAEERLGGKHGHKGEEAAITALKMIALKTSIHTT